jgi:hypothetical protein
VDPDLQCGRLWTVEECDLYGESITFGIN